MLVFRTVSESRFFQKLRARLRSPKSSPCWLSTSSSFSLSLLLLLLLLSACFCGQLPSEGLEILFSVSFRPEDDWLLLGSSSANRRGLALPSRSRLLCLEVRRTGGGLTGERCVSPVSCCSPTARGLFFLSRLSQLLSSIRFFLLSVLVAEEAEPRLARGACRGRRFSF